MSSKLRQYTVIAMFLLVPVIGLAYNALMSHRDQEAYARSMALLEAQEASPSTHRSFFQSGITLHEKCDQGFCWQATDPESLNGTMVRNGDSAGIPVIDMSALRKMHSRASASY